MNICFECEHCQRTIFLGNDHICQHLSTTKIDPVTGRRVIERSVLCKDANERGDCPSFTSRRVPTFAEQVAAIKARRRKKVDNWPRYIRLVHLWWCDYDCFFRHKWGKPVSATRVCTVCGRVDSEVASGWEDSHS